MATRTRRRGGRWLARVVALGALLAFWAALLVLAGLPTWTVAIPGAVAAALVLSAALPPGARLAAIAGRRFLGVVAGALAAAARSLAWTGRRGAGAVRASAPHVAGGIRAVGRGGAEGAGRGLAWSGRAAGVVWRTAFPSTSADHARRRRRSAELVLSASRLLRAGRARDAIARCEQALALVRPVGDHRIEAAALETLALAYVSRGDEEGALAHYERLLAVLGGLGDASGASRVLTDVSAVRDWRATADEPLTRWRRGLERLERPKQRRRKTPARKRASGQ